MLSISVSTYSKANTEPDDILYSELVDDRFEIYIDLPTNYDPRQSYSIAFYMDANLKMGKELRRQIALLENGENLKNVIFVGVGHIGSYRKRRRRDFIPPKFIDGKFVKSEAPYFGKADQFYKFLSQELIPFINEQHNSNGQYSLIGHSFSGLFAYYCLFQQEGLFKNHIALSPSLWANYNNFFEAETAFSKSNQSPKGYLYHACGAEEYMNKVLGTSRRMKQTLDQRNYKELEYVYVEHKGKGHNDMVPLSLEYILKHVRF